MAIKIHLAFVLRECEKDDAGLDGCLTSWNDFCTLWELARIWAQSDHCRHEYDYDFPRYFYCDDYGHQSGAGWKVDDARNGDEKTRVLMAYDCL